MRLNPMGSITLCIAKNNLAFGWAPAMDYQYLCFTECKVSQPFQITIRTEDFGLTLDLF